MPIYQPPGKFTGFSLLEFMLALLVFSIGLVGVHSTQLIARQANQEALQFTLATLAAAELAVGIQLNARHLSLYQATLAAWDGRPASPVSDSLCQSADCEAAQLARRELAQWQNRLSPAVEGERDNAAVGLPAVFACVYTLGPLVIVGVGWLGAGGDPTAERPRCTSDIGAHRPLETLSSRWNFVSLRTQVVSP